MKEKLIHFLKDLNIKMNNELLSLDVVEYVEKIKEHASIISVHNNDSLVAFIAYYDNDPNFDAIKLYEKYGFVYKEKRKNGFIYMEKKCKL